MSLLDTLDKIGGSNTPAFTLKIDGVDITGKVSEKLLSLTSSRSSLTTATAA